MYSMVTIDYHLWCNMKLVIKVFSIAILFSFSISNIALAFEPTYSRAGLGYPAHWPKEWTLEGARKRCAEASPQGCEQIGAIIYPKCKDGYESYGIAGLDCRIKGYNPPNPPPGR